MAGTVHVEGLVGLAGDQRVHLTLQQAQLDQPGGDHPNSGFVSLVPVLARGDMLEGLFVGLEHQLVNSLLLR